MPLTSRLQFNPATEVAIVRDCSFILIVSISCTDGLQTRRVSVHMDIGSEGTQVEDELTSSIGK